MQMETHTPYEFVTFYEKNAGKSNGGVNGEELITIEV